MQSSATDVAGYIAEAPPERQAALKKLRALHRKEFKDCEEVIAYGMPCYMKGETMKGAFASQKQYVALYGMGGVMAKYKPQLKSAKLGKGCVRFTNVETMDFDLIETMLHEAAAAKV